jgi:di/tricarboxylate transporter
VLDYELWKPWITVAMTLLVLYALARELAPPDVLFMGAIVILGLCRVITLEEAFAGFSNESVLEVAALFVVVAGLHETGVLDWVGHRFMGNITTEIGALSRLTMLVLPLSAVLNNTPIVAMLMPIVLDWSRKRRVSPSKLLIPLSFLTILGGACTLIGTSTNLVVNGLMTKAKMPGMSLFEISLAAVPCALIGVVYMLTIGRKLLPDRKELIEQLGESRREYLVEMKVTPGCRLIGQTVEAAGLRQLPGLFLIEIDRGEEIIAPARPDEVMRANDRLIFTGVVGTIVDLEKIPGFIPAADESYDLSPTSRRGRRMCEAVISATSPLIGKDVRNADFRSLYDAAVVAVHRNGSRLTNKIGDIVLRAGDTLLLQTGAHFSRAYRNNPDFYLVSDVENSRPLRRERAWISIAILGGLIAMMAAGVAEPVLLAFLAAGLMVATRCISASEARKTVEWTTLLTIASAFGLGVAIEKTGIARQVAHVLVIGTRPFGPTATLAAIYLGTMLLNELITNSAAAVLAFPLAIESARALDVSSRPFAIAVALAASFAFASPIGYQTHMMVYGPGGYRFSDFVRVGLPLNLLMWIAACAIIPFIWRF